MQLMICLMFFKYTDALGSYKPFISWFIIFCNSKLIYWQLISETTFKKQVPYFIMQIIWMVFIWEKDCSLLVSWNYFKKWNLILINHQNLFLIFNQYFQVASRQNVEAEYMQLLMLFSLINFDWFAICF